MINTSIHHVLHVSAQPLNVVQKLVIPMIHAGNNTTMITSIKSHTFLLLYKTATIYAHLTIWKGTKKYIFISHCPKLTKLTTYITDNNCTAKLFTKKSLSRASSSKNPPWYWEILL